jgi:general secretion pathway protein M
MSAASPLARLLRRRPALAIAGYFALTAALAAVALLAAADLLDRRTTLAATTALFERIDGRTPAKAGPAAPAGAMPAGSPFLEGQTVTIAGAALLQRVAAAVTAVGGNVLSSQVELQGSLAAEGFISLVASCEVEQPALQRLLYDLEAGMPFLFVDQLVVDAPGAGGRDSEGQRLKVLLGVSGRWQGTK